MRQMERQMECVAQSQLLRPLLPPPFAIALQPINAFIASRRCCCRADSRHEQQAMLHRHCGWLLAFKRPGLEASFWAYPPVHLHLLSIDRLAAGVVILSAVALSIKAELVVGFPGALWTLISPLWGLALMGPILAANALLWARRAAYSRHRKAIVLYYRTVCVFASYAVREVLRVVLLPTTQFGTGSVSASAAWRAVFQNLMLRSPVFCWLHCFLFPVAFRYQCLFQLATLPAALESAGVNGSILSLPQLRPAMCSAYRYLRIFVLQFLTDEELSRRVAMMGTDQSDPHCPHFAAQYVSWFFTLVFGVIMPLIVLYAIEACHRLWFLNAALGARTPANTVQVYVNAAAALYVAAQLVHFGISLYLMFVS